MRGLPRVLILDIVEQQACVSRSVLLNAPLGSISRAKIRRQMERHYIHHSPPASIINYHRIPRPVPDPETRQVNGLKCHPL